MANTYIDSNDIPRTRVPGAGEFAEILNNELAGANNVVATLHWLYNGDSIEAGPDEQMHHLIYLMEGAGTIRLNSTNHVVEKGAGLYLGPNESARISQSGRVPLKLFHIVVPKQG
ncbi:MAG: cupin domain-containing protein [Terriglobales bacterium]